MRIPLINLEITFAHAIAARIDEAVDERSAEVLRRYAHNNECLRAAVAAHFGLSDTHYVAPDSMLIAPMTRAINAFSAEMVRQRAVGIRGEVRA